MNYYIEVVDMQVIFPALLLLYFQQCSVLFVVENKLTT